MIALLICWLLSTLVIIIAPSQLVAVVSVGRKQFFLFCRTLCFSLTRLSCRALVRSYYLFALVCCDHQWCMLCSHSPLRARCCCCAQRKSLLNSHENLLFARF